MGSSRHENGNRQPINIFADHHLLSVYYEDLSDDPQSTFRKVTDFIGVRYVPPKTTLKKQNPGRLVDIVENYGELKSVFSGTEWKSFFQE